MKHGTPIAVFIKQALLFICLWLCAVQLQAQNVVLTSLHVSPKLAQADCHLIEFPNGSKVLIDAGLAVDAPLNTLVDYFKKRKINHLDLVIISHCHKDHYGELVHIIKSGVSVGKVIINVPDPVFNDTEKFIGGYDYVHVQSMLKFFDRHNIPYETPNIGDQLWSTSKDPAQDATLDVVYLYDGLHGPLGLADVNDTSIIVRLSYGKTRVLFTGDLNYKLGGFLARHANKYDIEADILKVPHHGADGLAPNEFFDKVGCKVAIVSTPKSVWFSPRCKRIRDYLSSKKIKTLVSSLDGDTIVTISKTGYTIKTTGINTPKP
jgi:competence protein ComEC